MAGEQFHHGIETIENDAGSRTIKTVGTSTIGMIGTAPDADVEKFPIHKPVLIPNSPLQAAYLGSSGTLPSAVDGVFDQGGASMVIVHVEEGKPSPFFVSKTIPISIIVRISSAFGTPSKSLNISSL